MRRLGAWACQAAMSALGGPLHTRDAFAPPRFPLVPLLPKAQIPCAPWYPAVPAVCRKRETHGRTPPRTEATKARQHGTGPAPTPRPNPPRLAATDTRHPLATSTLVALHLMEVGVAAASVVRPTEGRGQEAGARGWGLADMQASWQPGGYGRAVRPRTARGTAVCTRQNGKLILHQRSCRLQDVSVCQLSVLSA